jgi:hypothetical protein
VQFALGGKLFRIQITGQNRDPWQRKSVLEMQIGNESGITSSPVLEMQAATEAQGSK